MHNIDHLKSLIGIELEAFVIEITELKKRVAELELKRQPQIIHNQDSKEYIGRWIDKSITERSMITCNTSELI
jgi:hypothetical protein